MSNPEFNPDIYKPNAIFNPSSPIHVLPKPPPPTIPPRPPQGTVNLNRLRNQRNNQSNNFTQRVRRSVALRHASYPGLTVPTGRNRMPLANAVATLRNKNTRQRVSMNRTLRGNFEPENVNYRKTVPHATIRIGNRGLSQNQSKVFANIFASTNNFNSMKRRINRLNKPQIFKNALHARLNYLIQE